MPPAGSGSVLARLDRDALERLGFQEARDAIRERLGIDHLAAAAPQRIDPLFSGIAGREPVEVRLDGLPVGPTRWPESSLVPVPLIAVGSAVLRRYAPIDGPLSSTGGSVLDLSLIQPRPDRALSTFRLTQGSYGTFTDEIELRRPFRHVLFTGFFGDAKSDGRLEWGRQYAQTLGFRLGHRLAGGWGEWGVEDAFYRSQLATTKRALWDRTAWSVRWVRSDTSGIAIESSLIWSWVRGAWDRPGGRSQRKGRSLDLRVLGKRDRGAARLSAAIEAEASRVHIRRPGQARRLLEELSAGAAVGWERRGANLTGRFSGGVVRLAPLALSPVFACELELGGDRPARLFLHASRAVRNRTLPRLPTDGEAWVRQGIDLAVEEEGEAPEALWRAGLEGRVGQVAQALQARAGIDLLHATDGLASLADLAPLGIGGQDTLASELQRRPATFLSPWVALRIALPGGLRLSARSSAAVVEGGVGKHLGLPAVRWRGELAWSGAIFRNDLRLDLALRSHGQSEVATPYGTVAAVGLLDGEASGRVGAATLFFTLANLANVEQSSVAYEDGFLPLPLRHYRAGIRWSFLD